MRKFYKLMLMSLLFVSCVYVNKQNKEELYASTQEKEGLMAFSAEVDDSRHPGGKSYMWGFINADNDTIIKPMYFMAYDFHEGLALVREDTRTMRFGYINENNEYVIEPQYRWAYDFNDGVALVQDKESGKYGYINKNNEYVIEPLHYEPFDFEDGLIAVRDEESGKYGYKNYDNELVIPYIYDDAYGFGFHRDGYEGFKGLAMVNIGGDREDRYSIFPLLKGKWGLINKKGEVVLPIKYGYIFPFCKGAAFIYDGKFIEHKTDENRGTIEFKGKYGIINSEGKIVVSPRYDLRDEYPVFDRTGTAMVKKGSKEFRINTKGEVVK